VVHLMWLGPKPPPTAIMETWTHRFAAAHPHWSVKVWRDEDVLELGLSAGGSTALSAANAGFACSIHPRLPSKLLYSYCFLPATSHLWI
jgi:hypothetical protein